MIEININKLEKNYGFNKLLKDFNLEVKTSEIVALVGSNGCGKSTILNIISDTEPNEIYTHMVMSAGMTKTSHMLVKNFF